MVIERSIKSPLGVRGPPSVTRFGEILSFWQNRQSLGQFLRVYVLFGKILDRIGQILYAIGQVFIDVNDKC